MSRKYIGSSIDDFLKEEGIFEEAQMQAVKEVAAWQLAEAMKEKRISKNRMAKLAANENPYGPSDANSFMVNTGRDATLVGEEFRKRGILVGRKFPPMDEWLRVSVGTAEEMRRFMAVFKEVFASG